MRQRPWCRPVLTVAHRFFFACFRVAGCCVSSRETLGRRPNGGGVSAFTSLARSKCTVRIPPPATTTGMSPSLIHFCTVLSAALSSVAVVKLVDQNGPLRG